MLGQHVNCDELIQKSRELHAHKSHRTPHLQSLAYSSRYATTEVPKYEMPKKAMEAPAAYQIVHDELLLDGDSSQNMATFVTSWMEPEAAKLMIESFGKNFVDKDEYPKTVELQTRCVNMLAKLWNGTDEEKPVGTACVGSSEAFMLAGMALKFAWRNKRKKEGKPHDKPNIVFGHNAQVCLEKFALYFDVEVRKVAVTEQSRYVTDPKEAIKLCDENTIAVVSILGSTFTGHFENTEELAKELDKLQAEKGYDIPIHVDGASGGFIAPFSFPDCRWDFRLKRVVSINASGHKYGLVYPGVGWVIWRGQDYLPKELVFHIDYLGDDQPTFTLNFSRASSQVVAQYYNFLRLGQAGYKDVMENCVCNATFLSECILNAKYFVLHSEVHKGVPSVPVVSFSLEKSRNFHFDEYDLSSELKKFGWIVPGKIRGIWGYLTETSQRTSFRSLAKRPAFSESW
eukprot:TRINITY_DN7887_c0_g1_i2.p1 TRINITY_DN7887_c0_g1~~TRINITY_DN7887_c0_g1_i2.p1  ORF type:complete len:457 (+),score=93.79 TRINITY_DN7887_c0_g1_i2:289-1659(+)